MFLVMRMSVDDDRLNELRKVREALFGAELRQIAELENRVKDHDARIGSDERLTPTVAKILADALRQSRIHDHDKLSRELAPMLIDVIRTEVRNTRGEIVEALYPMTGRLVSLYVAESVSKLLDQTDSKLRTWFPLGNLLLLLRSAIAGKSYRKLKLAKRFGVKVEEVLVVKRETGAILDIWTASKRKPEEVAGSHVAAMLSAINEFANESLTSGNESLRMLDLGGVYMYLRTTPSTIIAVKCSGPGSGQLSKALDAALFAVAGSDVDRVTGAKSGRLASDLARRIEKSVLKSAVPIAPARPVYAYGIGSLVTAAALVFLAFWAADGIKNRIVTRRVEAIVSAVNFGIANAVEINVGKGGRKVTLSGFAPSAADANALAEAMRMSSGP